MEARMAARSTDPRENTQRDRFIEAARQLGTDEDEAAFKAKLAAIARQKPPPTKRGENDKT